ncbi:MAG TPA: AAA family ATPase [Candidatus Babeliales bacterium]|nr:AAA family ATPase [Candidatus Babeliales bacterium]
MLSVALFGRIRLSFDGDPFAFSQRAKALHLLAYLLLQPQRRCSRESAAFALWPDAPESEARANLRRHLAYLRDGLPPVSDGQAPWLLLDKESIAWNDAASLELDVAEFKRLRAEAATLEEAVAHYQGDLIEDLYDDWVLGPRESMRRAYLSDLLELCISQRSQRNFAKAAAYASELLRHEPLREDALRQLMAARYEAGDASGALAEFDRFKTELRAEIGAEPMPETIALRDLIIRGVALPSAADVREVATESSGVSRRVEGTPFVGRAQEMQQLRAHWRRAASGSGGVFLVRGDAGIGKSRFAAEFAMIAEAEGARVVLGATSAPERFPYQCLIEALRQAVPLTAATTVPAQALSAVAEIVPEIRRRRNDLPALPRLGDRAEQRRFVDAIAQILIAIAQPRPLVVLLEDLHWAGATTVEAIVTLATRVVAAPVLFVVTYRGEEVAGSHPVRALEHVARTTSSIERRELPALNEETVLELVAAIAGGDERLSALAPAIWARSGGHPLFTVEMTRDAISGQRELGEIPGSVRALVAERLCVMNPQARKLAEIAAVAGSGFSVELVRDLAGISEPDLLAGLEELLDRHLIREAAISGEDDYAFTHHIIYEAVYAETPPAARRRRHHRAARLLDLTPVEERPEMAARVARHYELGGDSETAVQRYLTAARHAARLYANAEARELAQRGLSLVPQDDRARFDLLLIVNRMSSRLLDEPTRRESLRALESVTGRLNDDDVLSVLRQRIEDARYLEHHDELREAIADLEQRIDTSRVSQWTAFALEARSWLAYASQDYPGAIRAARQARKLYTQLGDQAGRARAAGALAVSLGLFGQTAQAQITIDEARAISRGLDDGALRVGLGFSAANVAGNRNDVAQLAEIAREHYEFVQRTGDRVNQALCSALLGTALAHQWRVDEALTHLRDAMKLYEVFGGKRLAVIPDVFARFLIQLGDYETAQKLLLKYLDPAPATADEYNVAFGGRVHLADLAWQRGNLDTLEKTSQHLAGIRGASAAGTPWEALVARGRLLRCKKQWSESEGAIIEALEFLKRAARPLDEIEIRDDLAATLLAAGRLADASRASARAKRIAAAHRDRYAPRNPTRHYWIAACIAHAQNKAAAARRELEHGLESYSQRLAAISEPALRKTFGEIPIHRAMHFALERDLWPPADSPCVVAFPFGAPA